MIFSLLIYVSTPFNKFTSFDRSDELLAKFLMAYIGRADDFPSEASHPD